MSKNDLASRIHQAKTTYLSIGVEVGFQQAMDYVSCALRDPSVVGKDAWGPERQKRLQEAVRARHDLYAPAFDHRDPESDPARANLDRELRDCWHSDMDTFEKRYPFIWEVSYKKRR